MAADSELPVEAHQLRDIGWQPLETFLILVRRPEQ